jgi:hypothetical protein
MTFCAPAWSFQKSGAAALDSRRVSSSSGRAASKIAPQISGALAEILVAAHQLVDSSHRPSFYTARQAVKKSLVVQAFRPAVSGGPEGPH